MADDEEYPLSGYLTTNEIEIGDEESGGWSSQSDWEEAQATHNVLIDGGSFVLYEASGDFQVSITDFEFVGETATFVVDSADHDERSLVGEDVDVDIHIQNLGDQDGDVSVLKVGDPIADGTVEGGEIETLEFVIPAESTDGTETYDFEIYNEVSDQTDEFWSTEVEWLADEPSFEVVGSDYDDYVEVNTTVEVDLDIENVGFQTGDVAVLTGGNPIADETIVNGETETLEFNIPGESTSGTETFNFEVRNLETEQADEFWSATVEYYENVPEFNLVSTEYDDTAYVGDDVPVTYTVENVGYASGEAAVLRSGNPISSETISSGSTADLTWVVPGETEQGTYNYPTALHNVDEDVQFGSYTVTITFESDDPEFDIEDTSYPTFVAPGSDVDFTWTIGNSGDETGSVAWGLDGDGSSQPTTSLSVGGSSTNSRTETMPTSSGEYTYALQAYNDDTGSVDDVHFAEVTVS